MDLVGIIDNINLGLTIFMAVLPLFKDVVDRSNSDKPFLRKITISGWMLIGAGVLMIVLNTIKQKNDERNKGKENSVLVNKVTNNFKQLLKENNLVLDKNGRILKDTVTIVKTEPAKPQERVEQPQIALDFTRQPNAVFINRDTLFFYITSKSSPAYVISYRFLVFYGNDKDLDVEPVIKNGSYTSTLNPIYPDVTHRLMLFLNRVPQQQNTNKYVVLQILYTNGTNKKQIKFEKVFNIPPIINDNMSISQTNDFILHGIDSIISVHKY